MPTLFRDAEHDSLLEVISLLREQEQALWKMLSDGERQQYALRTKRIHELLQGISAGGWGVNARTSETPAI